MDIIENIEIYEQEEKQETEDQMMFNRMVNFLLDLDHDKLTVEQLDNLIKIVDKIEFLGGDFEEVKERKIYKRAKKSSASTRQYARNYYSKNKGKLKRRKTKIERSVDGKKRKKNKDKMAKMGKSPSGRNKIIYNTVGHTQ